MYSGLTKFYYIICKKEFITVIYIFLTVAKKKCHKNSDCFVCVIASHGQEEQTGTSLHDSYLTREQHIMGGVKYDTNHTQTKTTNLEKDLVKTSELIDIFSNDNCEGLRGKPKLFFIQVKITL